MSAKDSETMTDDEKEHLFGKNGNKSVIRGV